MNVEEIAEALARLSVPEDEARVWAYLRVLGPSKAADIASASDLSRARTYRALESLGHDGFVQTGVGRPRTYEAADPATVFDRLFRRAQRYLAEVEVAACELTPAIRGLERSRTPGMGQPRFDILRTRTTIHSHVQGLADDAGLSVDIFYSHPAVTSLMKASDLVSVLTRCARAGIGVRVLVPAGLPQRPDLPAGDKLTVRSVHTQTLGLRAIVDGAEAVVSLVEDESGNARADDCVAFATDAPHFVRMEQAHFETLWDAAGRVGDAEPAGRSETV